MNVDLVLKDLNELELKWLNSIYHLIDCGSGNNVLSGSFLLDFLTWSQVFVDSEIGSIIDGYPDWVYEGDEINNKILESISFMRQVLDKIEHTINELNAHRR
jgi:hypothetical protein